MCGIAGYVCSGDHDYSMGAMLGAMARRGPDSDGVASWPGVVLGHRRLAILDLSELGHQPMLTEDGRVGLVFNGCIYNFVELRADLESLGHVFRSRCDTEVLLRGYREWGIDALAARLHGMYAFGIWDEDLRKLFLVRDRLGVKPLVYLTRGKDIVFASTISAIRATAAVGEIDPDAVLEFLEFGFVMGDRCIYANVSKLPPAGILEWCDGTVSQRNYWALPDIDENSKLTFDDAVERTEELLIESVRLRLCSDVPIGALLSGGVDSGLVCWAMAKLNANIKAVTLSTPGDPSDETAAAAHTARLLGIPHETVHLGDLDSAPFDQLLAAYDEPFGSQSALGMLRVSAAVKPLATVLLTGDGGDDLFLGYPFFLNAWRAQRVARALPTSAAQVWPRIRPLAAAIPGLDRGCHFLDYATGGIGPYCRARPGISYFQKRGLFGKRLDSRHLAARGVPASAQSAHHLLGEVFKSQRAKHFTSEFLPKVDGGTMHYSLEARSPFLDQKMWEFAAALPGGIRLRDGVLKAVLREIARRRLGPAVSRRAKQGFTVPVEKWMAQQWRSSFESLRSGSILEREGWMKTGALTPVIDAAVSRGAVPEQLWFLAVLENWLRADQDRSRAQALSRTAHGAGRVAV